MIPFQPENYGSLIASLMETDYLMPLGPGVPFPERQGDLQELTLGRLFETQKVKNEEMAEACRAGLFLYHGWLEESHRISQNIPSDSGSYWHGIMHRRETDYANAKYWFQRVGSHPVLKLLGAEAQLITNPDQVQILALLSSQTRWNPIQFVDMCEAAAIKGTGTEMACRRIQQREWELLFDYCYRHALEDPSRK